VLEWPSERDDLDYSPDPRVTRHDVMTALGPDAGDLMTESDIDVDELIRLLNAETTMLPPIVVPDESSEIPSLGDEQFLDEPEPGLANAVRTWKKRFLKGAVMAVMITLTGGGAAALAMTKSVTLSVDGENPTIRSYGDTVGEVLDDAGITVGAHDSLSPSPQAPVGNGGVIQLERGRQLTLIVDGVQRESWVRATTVGEALNQLGLDKLTEKGVWLSTPLSGEVPLEGMRLEVKTPKHITLFDGGNKPHKVTTTAITARELLKELDITLGPEDEVEGGLNFTIKDGAEVRISRTGVSVINETEKIEPEVKEIEDPDLEAGKEIVVKPGKPGEKIVTYRITKKNNREVGREEISVKVVAKPTQRVVRVGTKMPEITDGAVWDRLAECESTGNWGINSGNGYYGGLQFDKGTWDAYGGGQYAAYPHQASREQQIAIATKVRDSRGGYGAWPACSSSLGLPQ
jgi:uncharacterized protein YabE (DUF348 family)